MARCWRGRSTKICVEEISLAAGCSVSALRPARGPRPLRVQYNQLLMTLASPDFAAFPLAKRIAKILRG